MYKLVDVEINFWWPQIVQLTRQKTIRPTQRSDIKTINCSTSYLS